MSMRVALYTRVSTDTQTTDNQIDQLREVADRNGWVVVREYIDEGISGSKGREQRPKFDALLKNAVRKEFDVVMSWSVDRLGRSSPPPIIVMRLCDPLRSFSRVSRGGSG